MGFDYFNSLRRDVCLWWGRCRLDTKLAVSFGLKDTSDLIFFEEYWGGRGSNDTQFVGLFKSRKYPTDKDLRKISRHRKQTVCYGDDAEVVAAAWVARDTANNILYVEAVGAVGGYGPTLYAAIFQMAFDDDNVGVSPSLKPGKTLQRASRIWQRFSTNYGDLIALQERGGEWTDEQWLNIVYSLRRPLLNLKAMRDRYRSYLRTGGAGTPRDSVVEMAKKGPLEHRRLQGFT